MYNYKQDINTNIEAWVLLLYILQILSFKCDPERSARKVILVVYSASKAYVTPCRWQGVYY